MAIAEILPLTDTSLDLIELRHRRRESAIHQFVQSACEHHVVRHPELLESLLCRRERLGSTALGRGFAVTGLWSMCVRGPLVLVGVSERGLDWEAPDERAVQLAALVLTPGENPEEMHFRRVTAVVAGLRLQRQRQRLIDRREPAVLSTLLRDVPR
ncbi:MAG TPA: PTS sugar transporter subunit IIA [Candidatus Eisenbacteria bacterium]|jgi:PTS system nitrogen regulatory IIA component